jgi:hypothetical protein
MLIISLEAIQFNMYLLDRDEPSIATRLQPSPPSPIPTAVRVLRQHPTVNILPSCLRPRSNSEGIRGWRTRQAAAVLLVHHHKTLRRSCARMGMDIWVTYVGDTTLPVYRRRPKIDRAVLTHHSSIHTFICNAPCRHIICRLAVVAAYRPCLTAKPGIKLASR